jgi:hypothetical protein
VVHLLARTCSGELDGVGYLVTSWLWVRVPSETQVSVAQLVELELKTQVNPLLLAIWVGAVRLRTHPLISIRVSPMVATNRYGFPNGDSLMLTFLCACFGICAALFWVGLAAKGLGALAPPPAFLVRIT